jgi:hypothetical protein
MNPTNPNQPTDPTGQTPPPAQPAQPVQVNNPLNVLENGEQNICQIKRHPIGLFGIYFSAAVLLIVIAVLGLAVAPAVLTNYDKSTVTEMGSLVFLVVAVFTVIFVGIAHKVYLGNSWILTTDSLTQVLQKSLFDKQSSQLSLGNLEDVTAQQDGILAHMFNFGVLRVETAGERSKFFFAFCPNPTAYAQQILRARENFEQGRHVVDPQRPYRAEGSYSAQISDQPSMPAQPQPAAPSDPAGVNIDTE